MRGAGVLLMIMGAGSFVLPKMGIQFKLISVFGQYQMHAAIGFLVVGALLFAMSLRGGKKPEKK